MQSQDSSTTGDDIDVSDPLDIEAGEQAWKCASNSQNSQSAVSLSKDIAVKPDSQSLQSSQPSQRSRRNADAPPRPLPESLSATSPLASKRSDSQNVSTTAARSPGPARESQGAKEVQSPSRVASKAAEVRAADTLQLDSIAASTAEQSALELASFTTFALYVMQLKALLFSSCCSVAGKRAMGSSCASRPMAPLQSRRIPKARPGTACFRLCLVEAAAW